MAAGWVVDLNPIEDVVDALYRLDWQVELLLHRRSVSLVGPDEKMTGLSGHDIIGLKSRLFKLIYG